MPRQGGEIAGDLSPPWRLNKKQKNKIKSGATPFLLGFVVNAYSLFKNKKLNLFKQTKNKL